MHLETIDTGREIEAYLEAIVKMKYKKTYISVFI